MHRMKLALIIPVLFIFMIILAACDPGWRYSLIEPHLDGIDHYYHYESDSLNIKVYANDFVYDTMVKLGITTGQDSITIYPYFSYISSTSYENKSHAPDIVYVELFSNDSLVAKRSYSLEETGEVSYSGLVNHESWENGDVRIQVQDRLDEDPELIKLSERAFIRRQISQISKEEFLQPLTLSRQDSLFILYAYKSFTIYRESRWPWKSAEVSGFRFNCDIYDNSDPIEFEFAPE